MFTVERDPQEVVVTLVEGRVAVTSGNQERSLIEMHARQQLRISDNGAIVMRDGLDPVLALAWREGKLIFDNEPLVDVVATMNNYVATPIVADGRCARAARQRRVQGGRHHRIRRGDGKFVPGRCIAPSGIDHASNDGECADIEEGRRQRVVSVDPLERARSTTRLGELMKSVGRLHHRALVIAAAFAALIVLSPAYAKADNPLQEYNIPSGDLGEALRAFGAVSNTQILFSPEVVAGRHSQGIRGHLSVEAAMVSLLANTSLTYRVTASNVILVTLATEADTPPPAAAPPTSAAEPAQDHAIRIARRSHRHR